MRRANSLRTRRAGADVGVSRESSPNASGDVAVGKPKPCACEEGAWPWRLWTILAETCPCTCGHVWPLAQILSEAKARAVGVARAGPEGFT